MKKKKKQDIKKFFKWLWWFIWEDDSWSSWIVNIILAFILVKFIIYPLLGLILGTSFPVVAVVSSSMEHNGLNIDDWWEQNGNWYQGVDITKEDMANYHFKNGFNKGDIMILVGEKPEDIEIGTVIVYSTKRYKYPIIHRVVKSQDGASLSFQTKGDNNVQPDPEMVTEDVILGKAVFRIPYLGWIKLIFTEIIGG